MSEQAQDLALVKQVQGGNKQAYNLLVAKYQFRLKQLVARFINDAAEQEDVVQEVFIKAYQALNNFRGDSAFYTWLYRIAVNTAKNHLKSQSRRPSVADIELQDASLSSIQNKDNIVDLNSPESQLQNDDVINTIKGALADLPPDLREALHLREFEGLSYDDIAQVMDCPIGTVRSRIFRAREAIEQALEEMSK